MGLSENRSGSGPPLVLIHGTGSCKEVWDPVLPALAARHEVRALDLPGFGDSAPLRVPHTVDSLADAVEAHLDEAGLERPLVAGNSLGGWVGLELARRGRSHGVVAISPSGLFTPREAAYVRRMVLAHYALGRRIGPLVDPDRPPPGAWAGTLVMMARPWRLERRALAIQLRQLGKAVGLPEAIADQTSRQPAGLRELRVPVLIAWGTRDRLLFPRQAERFGGLIPGAELAMLPGVGHMPTGDDPALVARTILDWTARSG